MKDAINIIIGLAVLLSSFWVLVDPAWLGQRSWMYGLNWWPYTWILIKGSMGPILIFLGLIIIWIAYEEARA